jgi:uncharacterized protein (TIGR03118 family)
MKHPIRNTSARSGLAPVGLPSVRKPIGLAAALRLALLTLLALAPLAAPPASAAPTIWNGPRVTFTKVAGADPVQPANQDRITPNVWLTRGSLQGLYNAKTESGFVHSFSPADTMWANGTTANYATLAFTDWNTWAKTANGGPGNTVGKDAVLHLVSDDIYIDITITVWDSRAGGFAYQRSTLSAVNAAPSVALTSPTNGATFSSPASVTVEASASDTDGTVAQVEFFDGTNSLGVLSASPYTRTVILYAGSHALTAVAKDNQGATTTATPVTVTVTTVPSLTYIERKLVSDLPGQAEQTDPNLVNPWGIASSPTGPWWIADNHTGASSLYNGSGLPLPLVVAIPPPAGGTPPGAPTGIVFNDTAGFLSGSNLPAHFIFATEDGTIVGWNSGTNAVVKADNSASGAVYKGLALSQSNGSNYLYAANFNAGRVDVFNASYNPVTLDGSFADSTIPAGFAPFDIQAVGNQLFVTYAVQDALKHDDVSGPGNGFVNVFDTSGHLLKRFASNGALNSPWGIALAPTGFGGFGGALLVGNFGDGRINAFDPATGQFLGLLQDGAGLPIAIQGLWGLKFGNGGQGGDTQTLYFTAGIAGDGKVEDHGLFGSLSSVVPTITSITDQGIAATIGWAGGVGPFLLQKKLSLSDTNWWNLLTTTNRSVTVAQEGASGFFRIVNQAPTTVLPFTVRLSGAAESPAVATPATGVGSLAIEGNTVTYHISYAGLSAAATAAHVHGLAAATNSAGVLFPVDGASGTAGVLSGSHTATAAELQDILNGLAYVNIHTAPHPGGEIRGQLTH